MNRYINMLYGLLILMAIPSGVMIAQQRDTVRAAIDELPRLGIDPANLQQVLDSLLSNDSYVRYVVIEYCGEEGVREAIPIFRTLFYQFPTTDPEGILGIASRRTGDRFMILRAAINLRDTTFQQEFRMEIDSICNIPEDFSDLLAFSEYLMEYHRDPYGFPAILPYFEGPNDTNITAYELYDLKPFLKSVHRDQVVNLLLSNGITSTDELKRGFAVALLGKSGDPRVEDIIVDIAKTDTSVLVRGWYALPALEFLNSARHISTIIEMLQTERDTFVRVTLYKTLMNTRRPAAYRYVFDMMRLGIDRSVFVYGENYGSFYEAFEPDHGISTPSLIDSLRSYLEEVATYTWLGDNSFVSELQNDLENARSYLSAGDSLNCAQQVKLFQQKVDEEYRDSLNGDNRFVTIEGWKFLYYNAQYILDRLPAPTTLSIYSLFATHSMWLEQNATVYSGDIGINAAGSPPFLDSQVELSVGIGSSTAAGVSVKAHRVKVKQGATLSGDVYYNELDNNGTITGAQHTPLTLPLAASLPEFQSSIPGTQNILVPQNGSQTLSPGSYGDIEVRRNGTLTFTGGEYHVASLTGGDNVRLVFQAAANVRIAGRFDSGQGDFIGPEDTTTVTADQIMFYVGGINGTNGTLGATPKAAKIGIGNRVRASFYAPNGTLWIRQNSEAKGAFIGKDVDVGIGVKIWR